MVVLVAMVSVVDGPVAGSPTDEQLPSLWTDCMEASDEYCVETLGYTPDGATLEEVLEDAVADASGGSSHPNMHVAISVTGGMGIYGKTLSSLTFDIMDPTSRMLGPVTRTGIQPGSYRLVLRTGPYRPHSMTIKGKPTGDEPFTVTEGTDGNYTWELKASSEAFVTLMDSTKWSACRRAIVDPECEADTAFVEKLSGILVLVPPNYVDSVVSPVSPSVDVTQGLWVASNTMVLDVKPELNMVTKSLFLPAYGPHFVPLDFPTAGLTLEGSRHLNPAYFEAFIPGALAAFMANFAMDDLEEKLPAALRATIETADASTSAAKEVEHPHSLTVTSGGGRVKVLFDHYSAPNPRVYVGAAPVSPPTSTTSSTVAATTVPSVTSVPATDTIPAAPKVVLRKGKFVSGASLVRRAGMATTKASRITLSVRGAGKKVCGVSSGRVLARRAGSCGVMITVRTGRQKRTSEVRITVR